MKPAGRTSKLNTYFGCPYNRNMELNPEWERQHIVRLNLPFNMRLAWDRSQRVNSIRVNENVFKAFDQAFNNIWNKTRSFMKQKYGYKYTSEFYDRKAAAYLRLLKLDLFGGSYTFRAMRGKASTLSYHSWGIAIDIDPANHVMGDTRATFPGWYLACWKSAGFDWGGEWQGKNKDSMHFERTAPSG